MTIQIGDFFSYSFMIIGTLFWFWGTLPLLGKKSIHYKLHTLSVADTLGSIAIIFGLLLQIPREWSLLLLAVITLSIWNTVLTYVIAYCSNDD